VKDVKSSSINCFSGIKHNIALVLYPIRKFPSKEKIMLAWFRALVERIKALMLSEAALDLEAQSLVRHAERKADLNRRAAALEAEGLTTVADELRRQADTLNLQEPLGLSPIQKADQDEVTPLRIAEGTAAPPAGNGKTALKLTRPLRKGS
jgi:hypothetical protein